MGILEKNRFILLYTMTNALGDCLVMGDLMRKIECLLPNVTCVMLHRKNPHVNLCPADKEAGRFYNVFSLAEVLKCLRRLRSARKQKTVVLGLQMAPGSLQGFALYALFKKLGALDYIVDFNLINADIITPPVGKYILELHLNQIRQLFGVDVPEALFHLELPFAVGEETGKDLIGIHPWNRRGGKALVWPFEKWAEVLSFLVERQKPLLVFGNDAQFDAFREYSRTHLPAEIFNKIIFEASRDVPHLIRQIGSCSGIVTVNTVAVHIGHALNKKMVILNGRSLDFWVPKGADIYSVYDRQAMFLSVGDGKFPDPNFPQVGRIEVADVCKAVLNL